MDNATLVMTLGWHFINFDSSQLRLENGVSISTKISSRSNQDSARKAKRPCMDETPRVRKIFSLSTSGYLYWIRILSAAAASEPFPRSRTIQGVYRVGLELTIQTSRVHLREGFQQAKTLKECRISEVSETMDNSLGEVRLRTRPRQSTSSSPQLAR